MRFHENKTRVLLSYHSNEDEDVPGIPDDCIGLPVFPQNHAEEETKKKSKVRE